jgi:hypothetical protein
METTTTNEAPAKQQRKAVRIEKTALKTLCSQLRIEPKAARRKLRKAGFSWHGLRERWMMTPKQLEQARNILKPPKPAKPAKAKPESSEAAAAS